MTELERWLLTLAQGPDTSWVVPPVGERTLDHQRILRVADDLYARGYLCVSRCGADGQDTRYCITDEGRRALERVS